jgi:hypothetical protein
VNERGDRGWARLPAVRIGAVIAIALAAAFAVWLLVRDGDDSPSSSTTTTQTQATTTAEIGPVAAGPAELRGLANEAGHPVYWVGPRPNRIYELTRTSSGRIFIRYLPPGVRVGNRSAQFTIVGSYPVENALDVLRELSEQEGQRSASVPGGGFAVYSASSPNNVYLAYPDEDVQIEVFDPSAERALRLATTGRVVPVS